MGESKNTNTVYVVTWAPNPDSNDGDEVYGVWSDKTEATLAADYVCGNLHTSTLDSQLELGPPVFKFRVEVRIEEDKKPVILAARRIDFGYPKRYDDTEMHIEQTWDDGKGNMTVVAIAFAGDLIGAITAVSAAAESML